MARITASLTAGMIDHITSNVHIEGDFDQA